MTDPTSLDLIAAERRRQIEKGYTAEHDREHSVQEFVTAAIAYLGGEASSAWHTYRPKRQNSERDLIRAAALIAAALDRLHDEEPS